MSLKHYLILLGGLALSAPAIARNPHSATVPQLPGMSARTHAVLNARLQSYERAARAASAGTAAKTTASAQRLIGVAYSEWSGSSPMVIDSGSMRYSGTRGSKFGEYILTYDFGNPLDKPGPAEYQDTYVNYDTLHYFDLSSGMNGMRWRSYNAANKVTLSESPMDERQVYSYLSNGKLDRVTTMYDNGGGLDSVQRDFYVYNLTGTTVKDSMEAFDSSTMSWVPVVNYVFTYNGTQMSSVQLDYNLGSSYVPLLRQDYTYGSNGKIMRILGKQLDQTTLQLVDASKDSIGYNGSTMISEDFYTVDPNTGSYSLTYLERRHLNAQGVPDSVSQLNPSSSGSNDVYLKLSYDANNYPTVMTTYNVNTNAPDNQYRYYYELNPNGVANVRAVKPLTLAPNPATGSIRLDNKQNGRFRILDINGRLMMEGGIAPAGTIAVESLAPGLYSITLSDASGDSFSGRFVKH